MRALFHIARSLLTWNRGKQNRTFQYRQLGLIDVPRLVEIEQAIAASNPDAVGAGEIHSKTPEQFQSILAKDSGTILVGAFANGKLVAFAATTTPQNPLHVREINAQRAGVLENSQHISVPISENDNLGTSILWLLRVDRTYQGHGIGKSVTAHAVKAAMGMVNGVILPGNRKADMVSADVTGSNYESLGTQFKAGEKAGLTTFIWGGGYDADAKFVPCLTTLTTNLVKSSDMPVLHSLNYEDALDKNKLYPKLIEILDAGYVALAECVGHDISSWKIHISHRPKEILELRGKGETLAPIIPPNVMRDALMVRPTLVAPNHTKVFSACSKA